MPPAGRYVEEMTQPVPFEATKPSIGAASSSPTSIGRQVTPPLPPHFETKPVVGLHQRHLTSQSSRFVAAPPQSTASHLSLGTFAVRKPSVIFYGRLDRGRRAEADTSMPLCSTRTVRCPVVSLA